ncbi:MAG: alkaline phosphatase [Capnocytophaga sp.]|nr:alkaline phosphatase [Capnocytophaga sp.]
MERRSFLKKSLFAGVGSMFIPSLATAQAKEEFGNRKAKNIIFMVSDGMSIGTMVMADLYAKRILGRSGYWAGLYEQNIVTKASMDMQSLSSVVTDSAAASSSWGGGHRIPNGSLNVGANGEEYTPIWQKFKKAGKKVGCVTTVPITHATPAGFCVNSKLRGDQSYIAEVYLTLNFDVMMGGGDRYFNPKKRKDKKDMYAQYLNKGYSVVKTLSEMKAAPQEKPLLGVFYHDAMPYTLDYKATRKAQELPTLAQMAQKAIEQMKDHKEGFVLQIEGGKVDWAAHGNDIGGLLFDQLAFEDAVNVAIEFAKKDGNTLVVVTSDHGNANPGLIYGSECNKNFDNLANFKFSNDWVLQNIRPKDTPAQVKDFLIDNFKNIPFTEDQAKEILAYYNGEKKEDGLYNYKKLPYQLLADLQKPHTSVGWISMDHSSDYTELAMYGPGSEKLKPFIKNYEMHNFLLEAAGVDMLEVY